MRVVLSLHVNYDDKTLETIQQNARLSVSHRLTIIFSTELYLVNSVDLSGNYVTKKMYKRLGVSRNCFRMPDSHRVGY